MPDLDIYDIQRFSVNDGPGIRTTVFLKGCPLSCFWCHNPESQSARPELLFRQELCLGCEACAVACPVACLSYRTRENRRERLYDPERCLLCGSCVAACPTRALTLSGRSISHDALFGIIMQDAEYYLESKGGVTFSGGEPLAQSEALAPLTERLRLASVHVAIDTAGHVPFGDIERVAGSVDLFLYDIKHMDPEKHRMATGSDNRLILENLERLVRRGAILVIRVPVVPGFNDSEADIAAIAEHVAGLGLKRMDLLPFHQYARSKYASLGRDYQARDLRSPDPGRMERLASVAGGLVEDVRIEQH